MSMRGQSSGDFKETSGRVHLFHVVTRNAVGALTPDAFTQSNPVVFSGAGYKSTTLAGITKVGVLGGSVAFTRPQVGNNLHGGPFVNVGPAYLAGIKPLGIYINDAVGNAFENTPGPASGRGSYVCGAGSCIGVTIYETQQQLGGGAGTALSPGYVPGDLLYASVNGLLTNKASDSYEVAQGGTATVIGIVKAAPDANTPMLVLDLRV